jgi:hypothetical protein
VPKRRITGAFLKAQHPLNMSGVSKRLQQSVIQLLPAAQLVAIILDNMKIA